MPSTVTIRIVVHDPVPGVALRLQRGSDELVPPVAERRDEIVFELSLNVVPNADGTLVLRGPEAHGPPAKRFAYINSGTYAGNAVAGSGRRAKVPLATIPQELLTAAITTPGAVIVGAIAGRAKDGGPAAASVPMLGDGWRIS